jgi:hypothetical protein
MARLTPYPIQPPPGVVLTESDRVVEGRWKAADKMRFVKGRPQKIGGWLKASEDQAVGTPRALHGWRDLESNQYIAQGTEFKLGVFDTQMELNDVTPIRFSGTLANNPFTTASGSSVISVAHTGHGLSAGDYSIIAGSADVGGISPNGSFTVETVTSANAYTYRLASGAASSTATGGGSSATFSYEVSVGASVGTFGLGWGVGGWGLGTWGTAREGSTIYIEPRIWTFSDFGKLLIASYNGGSIYKFDPTVAQPWPRATLLSSDPALPTDCRAVFVTPERFVVALRDDMQVSWSSQGDYATWTPALGNTANSRRLSQGTKLVNGKPLAPGMCVLWSDAALFRMQYVGGTNPYNTSMVAQNCGLIAPNACISVNGVAYWMGHDNFFMYAGGVVMPLPNVEDVREHVFKRLTVTYGYQCSAVYNPRYNEIWFFYTEEGEINPNRCLIYSINDQCFSPIYNVLRTCGTNLTQGDTRPYMASTDGYLYRHEIGNDADGEAMPWTIELAPYALDEGRYNIGLQSIVPDFFEQDGDVALSVEAWDRINDSASIDTDAVDIAAVDSGAVDLRITGRYLGMTFSGEGGYARFGKPVVWGMPIGGRGG